MRSPRCASASTVIELCVTTVPAVGPEPELSTSTSANPHRPAIVARGLGKRYARSTEVTRRRGLASLRREILARGSHDSSLGASEFWALRDIDFSLEPGEVLGVMGLNGSGKSTLLRVLAGLSKADTGTATIDGRVSVLLDPMGGADPLLTGRENLETSPMLWSVAQSVLASTVEMAIEFAELGTFIDAPVRSYSKGMRMRLAFATMAATEADIFLIDEALAVGDVAFQRKCMAHLRRTIAAGASLVLVSHSAAALGAICDRGLVLQEGSSEYVGPIAEAVSRYSDMLMLREATEGQLLPLAQMAGGRPRRASPSSAVTSAPPGGGAEDEQGSHPPVADDPEVSERVEELRLLGPRHGRPIGFTHYTFSDADGGPPRAGAPLHICLGYLADCALGPVDWGVMFFSGDGQVAVAAALTPPGKEMYLEEGSGELHLVIPELRLSAGRYTARTGLVESKTQVILGLHGMDTPATPFEVVGASADITIEGFPAFATLTHSGPTSWSVSPQE